MSKSVNSGRIEDGRRVGGFTAALSVVKEVFYTRGMALERRGRICHHLAYSRPYRPHSASWRCFCISGKFRNVYKTKAVVRYNQD